MAQDPSRLLTYPTNLSPRRLRRLGLTSKKGKTSGELGDFLNPHEEHPMVTKSRVRVDPFITTDEENFIYRVVATTGYSNYVVVSIEATEAKAIKSRDTD
jgi:hypothetical protein